MEAEKKGRVVMRKKKRIKYKKLFCMIAGFVFLCVLVIYFAGVVYYRHHFLKDTVVNGLNLGKRTIEGLKEDLDNYELTILEKDGNGGKKETVIKGSDLGLSVSDEAFFENLLEEQPVWSWFLNHGTEREAEAVLTADTEKVEQFVESLPGVSDPDAKASVNAYISDYVEGEGYHVVPEEIGMQLEKELVREHLITAIEALQTEIDLEKADCYKKPEITSEDETLCGNVKKLNTWLSARISYNFDGKSYVVDASMIQPWLIIKKKKVSLDEDKIKEFVDGLRRKYDTIFQDREFTTTYGDTITIKGGDYGWWMNASGEAKKLTQLIKEGKTEERTPEYYQKAASYTGHDYGDSYVEINLTAQHLFVYKKGKKVFESDFVSGNESLKNGTPVGVYSLTYKEQMAELVGEDYASPVSYWMPFNENIGMHDATWRSQFGANLYRKGGSHGCINLPYEAAKKIYDYVEKTFPVVVYKLPGTESTSITKQSDEDVAKSVIESIKKIDKKITKESKKRIKHSRAIYNELTAIQKRKVTNYQKLVDAEKELKDKGLDDEEE